MRIFRKLAQLLDVDTSGVSDGDALTYDAGESKWVPGSGGGGAPTDADYLVGTSNGSLSGEIVVGTSPGGELGGTWASPTVDTTHSGSSHASVQAAAEATAASALSTHSSDTTGVHGIADTSALVLTGDSRLTDSRTPTGSAGGVLGGTYPNPSFASDMATQAELDAHVNDTSDAHDASAISIADAGNDFTATDVEGALAELQSDAETDAQNLADHIADSSDAHDASAISVLDTNGDYTATDVEGVLAEIAPQLGGGGGATFAGVKALRAASQTIASSTEVPIQFSDSDEFDTDGYHDPSSNNTRITIPTGKAGRYLIQGEANWQAAGSGDRVLYIKLNGTTYSARANERAASTFGNSQQISGIITLADGDYVELVAYQNDATISASLFWFAAVLLG